MLKSQINKIESILFESAKHMNLPTIEGDLGALIFEATLYRYSKDEIYKEKSLQLLNKLLDVFGERELYAGFLEGFEGIFYTVQYLKRCNIIDNDTILEDLEEHLLRSLSLDIKLNNYDPLHGSVGKLLYIINAENKSQEEKENLISDFLIGLQNDSIMTEEGIFWFDKHEGKVELVCLGLAHGTSGILTFLLRLKELEFKNPLIDKLLKGGLRGLLSTKNKISCVSAYPTFHSKNIEDIDFESRLGWCAGDLGIAHTLFYANKILKDDALKKEAHDLLGKVISRNISNSKLIHYEDYSFFDTGFCHGISGIVYILHKINSELNNDQITKRMEFWTKELIHNLDKQLSLEEDIYLPWYRQDTDYSYTLDKNRMLNGYVGVGLVLLSLEYKKYDWSDFFMLFNFEN
jgi:lantibiotic modifying enzyme